MRILSLIVVFLISLLFGKDTESPHGDDFKISCSECHSPKSWELDRAIYSFDHNSTKLPLTGQHTETNCKMCHPTLVFSEAGTDCMSCHEDMHYQTLGPDCARCHTPKSWIVENITEIHQMGRFPLLGAHFTADCYQCHPSSSLLRFEPLGIECIDCHRDDYTAATNPDHVQGNISTNCIECHSLTAFSWSSDGFNHAFFPLTQGHAISDCNECHTGGDYSSASPVCVTCHQSDYNSTTNPNHIAADISTDCIACHTTNPGWKPAEFDQHDAQYFPIYSGQHNGEWSNCVDCHTNPGNYAQFTCIDCHEHNQTEMDDEHQGIGGYAWNSIACLECHPTGDAEGSFNHSTTNFPLTGAHVNPDCKECHPQFYQGTSSVCYDCHTADYNQSTNPNHLVVGIQNSCEECHTADPGWTPAQFGIHNEYYPLTGAHGTMPTCFDCHEGNYTNTPNECASCHTNAYNQTSNPNHNAIGISSNCETCHTTNPDWKPAEFPTHNDYYLLEGAHVALTSDCFICHEGNYNSAPNDCFGCHDNDYNQTNNPPHQSAQFPVDCEICHSQSVWEPSTFDHDGQYFPIYSGKHSGEWDQCSDCHDNPGSYAIFTCLTCHTPEQTNADHSEVTGYVYNSMDCLQCHPNGNND